MWHIYILECEHKALYVGLTNNIKRRFKEHLVGEGGHYTSYSKPTKTLYHEKFESRSQAECREKQLKRWTKEKKLALIRGDFERLKSLSASRD